MIRAERLGGGVLEDFYLTNQVKGHSCLCCKKGGTFFYASLPSDSSFMQVHDDMTIYYGVSEQLIDYLICVYCGMFHQVKDDIIWIERPHSIACGFCINPRRIVRARCPVCHGSGLRMGAITIRSVL